MTENNALCKKAPIHQVTTMLATSKNVLFPGPNHMLTTSADDPSLAGAQPIIKVSSAPVVSRCLGPGSRTFLKVAGMVVTWWIVAFCAVMVFSKVKARIILLHS